MHPKALNACRTELLHAVLWAVPVAVAPVAWLPLAALWSLAGLWATRRRHYAGLVALPALLASLAVAATARPAVDDAGRAGGKHGPVTVRGTVDHVVRAPLTDRCWVWLGRGPDAPCLSFDGDVELSPGDTIRALARRRPPAVGRRPPLRAIRATLQVTPGTWSVRRGCAQLRRAVERQLLRLAPGEHGAMLATLVLGRATRPPPELAEAHRGTGLSHLLAVSGAHAAMLAMLLGLSSRARHLGASRTRSRLVLVILCLYGAVAGAEPPVLRAVFAFVLASLAARLGRPFSLTTGLLAPALLTCFVDPTAVTSPSFLLSYAAVTGLLLAMAASRQQTGNPPPGPLQRCRQALRASLWATLLTTPFTLWFFGQLAPWTIVLTPLCAPLVAAMLMLGLLAGGAALAAPVAGELLAPPLIALAECYTAIVHTADGLPGTPISARYVPPPWALLLVSCAAVLLITLRPQRSSVAVGAVAVTGLWFVPLAPHAGPSLILHAVGHGQAAQLTTAAGKQVVIDCGSLRGGRRAARPLLATLSNRHIDLLVVTHADQDHHNGLAELLAQSCVQRALLPTSLLDSEVARLLAAHDVPFAAVAAGHTIRPMPALEIAAPELPATSSDNDHSLWVRAHCGTLAVLLPGDAEERGIAAMLATPLCRRTDVLLLPHHGRANAAAPQLLAHTRPRACLASAAAEDGDTALGHLARRAGAELWVTGRHGTIGVEPTADGARIAGTLGARPLPR